MILPSLSVDGTQRFHRIVSPFSWLRLPLGQSKLYWAWQKASQLSLLLWSLLCELRSITKHLNAEFYVVFSFLDRTARHAETFPNTFHGCSNQIVSTLYGIWQGSCRSSALNMCQLNVLNLGPSSPRTASLSQMWWYSWDPLSSLSHGRNLWLVLFAWNGSLRFSSHCALIYLSCSSESNAKLWKLLGSTSLVYITTTR